MNKQNMSITHCGACSDIILVQLPGSTVPPRVSHAIGAGSGSLKCSTAEVHSQSTLKLKVKLAGGVVLCMLVLWQFVILLCYRNPQYLESCSRQLEVP